MKRVRANFVQVICGLGVPDDIGVVAVDKLPVMLKRGAGLAELCQHRGRQRLDGLLPFKGAVRRKQDGIRRVVGQDAVKVALAEGMQEMLENVSGQATSILSSCVGRRRRISVW